MAQCHRTGSSGVVIAESALFMTARRSSESAIAADRFMNNGG